MANMRRIIRISFRWLEEELPSYVCGVSYFFQSSFFILRFLGNAESLLGIWKVDNSHICFHSKTYYGNTINTKCLKQEEKLKTDFFSTTVEYS
jgi:hypothetical protein